MGLLLRRGVPLYWEKVSETHYIDGRTVRDVEYNFVNLSIDLMCYSLLSGVFVYGFDKVSLFLESSLKRVRGVTLIQ